MSWWRWFRWERRKVIIPWHLLTRGAKRAVRMWADKTGACRPTDDRTGTQFNLLFPSLYFKLVRLVHSNSSGRNIVKQISESQLVWNCQMRLIESSQIKHPVFFCFPPYPESLWTHSNILWKKTGSDCQHLLKPLQRLTQLSLTHYFRLTTSLMADCQKWDLSQILPLWQPLNPLNQNSPMTWQ